MLKAVLFDLDDTLLVNDIDRFLPAYFKAISKFAASLMDPQHFMQILLACTEKMIQSTDTAVTNRSVFWQAFHELTGRHGEETEQYFEQFYRTEFPKLAGLTKPQKIARPLIRSAQKAGLKVVVATNPLFPPLAIEHRLKWAGLPSTDMQFDLITTYANMHSTKPQVTYYQEILEKIQVQPDEALMVGDDWENDIVPAAKAGLWAYWLGSWDDAPNPSLIVGAGTLDDLFESVRDDWQGLVREVGVR
jgi:HAD superfamily hydrolase (TIGR01549 family)